MFTAAGFERTWEYIDLFKEGLICTVSLSLLTVIFGFVLALLLAIMRLSNVRPFRFLGLTKDGHLREQGVLMVLSRFNPLSFIATVYVEVFRATPMLVQLFMIYYVVFGDIDLPSFKIFGTIRFERFLPGVIALSLNSGAYLSEIIRSGIQSIDGGQTEAARSLGLSQVQNMRFVDSAAGYQEYPACHRQRVRHHYQGVFYLLYHRRSGDHVRGFLHQRRDLPHCGTACGGRLCLLLPDVPHQQDHRLLRKENEPWRPEIS